MMQLQQSAPPEDYVICPMLLTTLLTARRTAAARCKMRKMTTHTRKTHHYVNLRLGYGFGLRFGFWLRLVVGL